MLHALARVRHTNKRTTTRNAAPSKRVLGSRNSDVAVRGGRQISRAPGVRSIAASGLRYHQRGVPAPPSRCARARGAKRAPLVPSDRRDDVESLLDDNRTDGAEQHRRGRGRCRRCRSASHRSGLLDRLARRRPRPGSPGPPGSDLDGEADATIDEYRNATARGVRRGSLAAWTEVAVGDSGAGENSRGASDEPECGVLYGSDASGYHRPSNGESYRTSESCAWSTPATRPPLPVRGWC